MSLYKYLMTGMPRANTASSPAAKPPKGSYKTTPAWKARRKACGLGIVSSAVMSACPSRMTVRSGCAVPPHATTAAMAWRTVNPCTGMMTGS